MGKNSPNKRASESADPQADHIKMRKEQIITLAERAPSKVRPYVIDHAEKLAGAAYFVEAKCLPLVVTGWEKTQKAYAVVLPHLQGENMQDLLPGILGVFLCFFGGTFPLLIASFEAFRMAGYDGMMKSIGELKEQIARAYEAHKKDEEVDADGDGIPDVQQISQQELMTRKAFLFLKVCDPEKIQTAFHHLLAGLMAVIATLKVSFAMAVTLGASLADVMQKNVVDRRIYPYAKAAIPADYQKWIKPFLESVVKMIAVSVAFMVQRAISAFHAAVKGGQMAVSNLLAFADRKGYFKFNAEESQLDEYAGNGLAGVGLNQKPIFTRYGLAGLGFLFQVSNGFSLFFPLNLLFLPCSTAETMFELAVVWF